MNMKALIAGTALGLALPFSAVLVSAPAQADRCSIYQYSPDLYQKCENDNKVAATGTIPVCAPGGVGGMDCVNCTGALGAAGVTDPNAISQANWDCGESTGQGGNPLVTQTPHCAINGVPTGQPKPPCFGNYVPNGQGAETVGTS